MNYRHSFHAGNFADVDKHVVLLALLERLKRKPKPLFYLDTHAGRGWYDLHCADAQRGGEWRTGVARLVDRKVASPDLQQYLREVAAPNATAGAALRRYPGSPVLAMHSLRDIDRIVLVERQILEARGLEQSLRGRRGISVVCGDGYAALKTFLPPRENRGLVLIDPPYESDSELVNAERALRFGLSRWPNGIFALWYPIKAGPEPHRLQTALQGSGLRKLLQLELYIRPEDSPLGLNGSGLIVANPPWQFDTEIAPALAEAHEALAVDGAGGSRVRWLAGE